MKKENLSYIIGGILCILGIMIILLFRSINDYIYGLCLTPIYAGNGELDYAIPQYPLGFSGAPQMTCYLLLTLFVSGILLILISWKKDEKKTILLISSIIVSILIVFTLFIDYWGSIKGYYVFTPKIKQIESIDIDQEFSENMKAKDYRVVVVMAYGECAPGFRDYEEHAKKYGKRRIEGTSDCASSNAENAFNHIAINYAKKYNEKLIQHLKKIENVNHNKIDPLNSDSAAASSE